MLCMTKGRKRLGRRDLSAKPFLLRTLLAEDIDRPLRHAFVVTHRGMSSKIWNLRPADGEKLLLASDSELCVKLLLGEVGLSRLDAEAQDLQEACLWLLSFRVLFRPRHTSDASEFIVHADDFEFLESSAVLDDEFCNGFARWCMEVPSVKQLASRHWHLSQHAGKAEHVKLTVQDCESRLSALVRLMPMSGLDQLTPNTVHNIDALVPADPTPPSNAASMALTPAPSNNVSCQRDRLETRKGYDQDTPLFLHSKDDFCNSTTPLAEVACVGVTDNSLVATKPKRRKIQVRNVGTMTSSRYTMWKSDLSSSSIFAWRSTLHDVLEAAKLQSPSEKDDQRDTPCVAQLFPSDFATNDGPNEVAICAAASHMCEEDGTLPKVFHDEATTSTLQSTDEYLTGCVDHGAVELHSVRQNPDDPTASLFFQQFTLPSHLSSYCNQYWIALRVSSME